MKISLNGDEGWKPPVQNNGDTYRGVRCRNEAPGFKGLPGKPAYLVQLLLRAGDEKRVIGKGRGDASVGTRNV